MFKLRGRYYLEHRIHSHACIIYILNIYPGRDNCFVKLNEIQRTHNPKINKNNGKVCQVCI